VNSDTCVWRNVNYIVSCADGLTGIEEVYLSHSRRYTQ